VPIDRERERERERGRKGPKEIAFGRRDGSVTINRTAFLRKEKGKRRKNKRASER